MADPNLSQETQQETTVYPEEAGYEIEAAFERDVIDALDDENAPLVRALVEPLHYADVADLLEHLSHDHRVQLIGIIRDDFDPDMLTELDESLRDDMIDWLGVEDVAAAVAELDTDDAVDFVEELDEDDQQQLLDAMPETDRLLIEQALTYPEDSAGRLMQREFVRIPTYWNVGQTIDYLRQVAEQDDDNHPFPDVFYNIYVVDPKFCPAGMVPLSRLLQARRVVPVTDLMDTEMRVIAVDTDQEDVAFLFRQRDLVSAPVVDDGGRIVGVITIDDVVDVIHEEQEEDILRMGGVHEDDLYEAALYTTRSRFSWLAVNLLTAIVASLVIGLFEATIDEVVALAVLMPIVASMGGNAGTQTLTVAVRAIAMKELSSTNAARVIGKEALVGVINGVLFAILAFCVAWGWFGSLQIGIVIAIAMIVNMIVAALAGTTIPLMLERVGVDPAIASSVFLTTVTDVVGFFAFLGLAAIILL